MKNFDRDRRLGSDEKNHENERLSLPKMNTVDEYDNDGKDMVYNGDIHDKMKMSNGANGRNGVLGEIDEDNVARRNVDLNEPLMRDSTRDDRSSPYGEKSRSGLFDSWKRFSATNASPMTPRIIGYNMSVKPQRSYRSWFWICLSVRATKYRRYVPRFQTRSFIVVVDVYSDANTRHRIAVSRRSGRREYSKCSSLLLF